MSIRHRQASSSLLNVGKVFLFAFCFAAEVGYRGLVLRKQRGVAWKTNGEVLDGSRRASGSKRDEGLEEEGRWAGHRRGWMEGCWEVTSEVLSGQREGWGQGSLRDPQPFMVELCPPDRNAQVLTPDTYGCDLLGKRVFADIIKLR